jgi:hypothetical protein
VKKEVIKMKRGELAYLSSTCPDSFSCFPKEIQPFGGDGPGSGHPG